MKDFQIRLDRQRCIGAENCARLAPSTFDTQDGAVILLPEPHDTEDRIRAAAEACPMQAIHLESINRLKENIHDK